MKCSQVMLCLVSVLCVFIEAREIERDGDDRTISDRQTPIRPALSGQYQDRLGAGEHQK